MTDGQTHVFLEKRLVILVYTYCTIAPSELSFIIIHVRLTHTNVWESMGETLATAHSLLKAVFLLQVTRESVSGTTSHMRASEHAMKLKVRMIKSLSP